MVTTSYTEARAHFAELLAQVTEDRVPVVITRRGHESVAMIAEADLDALIETVHLLRSRANAERLLTSLARAKARTDTPTDLAVLQAELGLGDE
jgi:antitoxin YefM